MIFKSRILIFIFVILTFYQSAFSQNWQAVDKERQNLSAKYQLAFRLEKQGRKEQALELYKFIFEKQPNNNAFYNRYIQLLFSMQKYSELEKILFDLINKNSKNINATIDLGKLYFVIGDSVKATNHWDKSIEKFDHSIAFYRALYHTMVSLRNYNKAEKVILQARKYHEQDDLFALELGNIYSVYGKYMQATEEFLKYAKLSERNFDYISRQILRFPNEENIFPVIDSVLQIEIKNNRFQWKLHKLRAEFLFKYNKYKEAGKEIFIVEELTKYSGKYILDFAKDLTKIKKYKIAESIYNKIIEEKKLGKIAPAALLGMANAIEKSVLKIDIFSPLKYFYPENIFFEIRATKSRNINQESLIKAFSIYDSMIETLPKSNYSAQALFRLAKLRYLALKDYDGAVEYFHRTSKISKDKNLQTQCKLHIGRMQIAKGNPDQAIRIFQQALQQFTDQNSRNIFQVYNMQAVYLSGNPDSALSLASQNLKSLGIKHKYFNDVFEFKNFLEKNYKDADIKGQEAFKNFIKGELLLQQEKLSEAYEFFSFLLINYPDSPISKSARFRLAQLQIYFNEFTKSEATLSKLFDLNQEYCDIAAFMLAETAQYIFLRNDKARKWYSWIIEHYNNSFYYEIARKRLREIQAKQIN